MCNLRTFLIVAVLLGSPAGVGIAGAQPKKSASRALADALEQTVEIKPFQERLKLKRALEDLSKKAGKLPFVYDLNAFERALGADAPYPYEEEVWLPEAPPKMKVSSVLRLFLGQIAKGHATYLIRNGVVEVTTTAQANPEILHAYPITARFERVPFEDAIETLSDLSGATIVIDTRLGEKAKTPISANFRGTVTLENSVKLLARMVDLTVENEENALFITTKPKATDPKERGALNLKNRRLDLAVKDVARWGGRTVILDPLYLPLRRLPIVPFTGDDNILYEDNRWLRSNTLLPGSNMGTLDPDAPKTTRITATFTADTSAEAAARLIAQQAGLRVMVIDKVIYITRPSARSTKPAAK